MKRDRKTKHEIRDEICNYISENPGISFPAIQKAFRLNTGTLRYHLQYLEGEDRIKRLECLSRKYCSSDSSVEGILKMEGLSRSQRRIALLIKDRPGISLTEIRSESGKNGEDLKYTLKRLQEKRFVWKVQNGRDPRFEFISKEEMAAEMLIVVLEKFLHGEINRATFLELKESIEKGIGSDHNSIE
jgi:predicted transcriptional regulator